MEDADDGAAHTILIRDVRALPTMRERKVSSKASLISASCEEEALSKAFPLLQHETPQHQTKRIQAYQTCWSGLSSHVKEVLEDAAISTFRELGAYAKAQHAQRANAAHVKHRLVPTALAVAGSMNSADHAGTFSNLVAYLREQGCHAGLLQHQDLAANKGVSTALNSIMRQFSGFDMQACDMEALQAWYADELAKSTPPSAARQAGASAQATKAAVRQAGTSGQADGSAVRQNGASGQASAARSPAKRPKPSQGAKLQSPPKRRQVDASRRTTRSRAAQQGAARAANSPVRSLVSDSESDIVVHLSDDDTSSEGKDPEPEPAAQPGPSLSKGDQPETSQEAAQLDGSKPLVVVVENTEAADPATLQDLILVLSQARVWLPVTLVLGMSISVAALRHMLPVKAADVLQAKEFRLAQAKTLLESVVRQVLLGPRFHGLLFHHRLLDDLLHHFLSHDFSVTCIRQGLQMACLRHFQSEPLSVLVPAAASGPEALAQACGALPQALRSGIEGSTARQSLGKVMGAWAAWAVSLRWMHAAAQALGRGHSAASDGLSLSSLYVDASDPRYMARDAAGQTRLRALCGRLETLSDERCRGLLLELLQSAQQVAAGPQAVKEDLATLNMLLAEAEAEAFQGEDSAAAAAAAAVTVAAGTPQQTYSQQQEQGGLLGMPGSARGPPVTPAPARRESMSLASMLKKQKAPLSGAQRTQQLLGGDLEAKGLAGAPEARGLGVRHQQKPRLAVRVAGLIQQAVSSNLAKLPTSMAGAKALCCSSHAEVKEMMSAAPRWVVHQALAERTPATYTARQAASEELGISPDMEDAAIAYRLLLEYGESVGVADWFQSFCAVFHTHAGIEEAEASTPGNKTGRRRGKKQSQSSSSQAEITKYMSGKRRGQRALSPIPEGAAEEAAETSGAPAKPRKGRALKASAAAGKEKAKRPAAKTKAAMDVALDAVPSELVEGPPLQDLAVRFSCATKELQFLGLIKESTCSRKDGTVQRLAYPMHVQTA